MLPAGAGLRQRGQKVLPHNVLVALGYMKWPGCSPGPLNWGKAVSFFYFIFCTHIALGSSGQAVTGH